MRVRAFLAILVLLLMFTGSLGLRTVQDCDSDPNVYSDSLKIDCYHTAAITQAYLCGQGAACKSATDICGMILTKYVPTNNPTGSDLLKKAELVANTCYYDVATITANPNACGFIQQQVDWGSTLFGAQVTQEACVNQATRLASLNTKTYYQNNMCAPLLILPMIAFAAFHFRDKGV